MLRNAACRAHWAALIAACLTGALCAGEGAAPQKHSLRYRFAPDSALHYTVGDDKTINVQVGAAADMAQHESETGRVLSTTAINPDGSAVLKVTIEYVNLSAGNGAIQWDSRSGEDPPLEFKGIENTIGKPLMHVTIAPNGAVVAAESGGNVATREQLGSTQFDLFPILPDQPVAVGESWTEPFEVEVTTDAQLTRKISLQREYTLHSADKGIAEISVRTNVITPVQDPQEERQLIQRTPAGSFRLDIAQGRLLERIMKLDNKVIGFNGPQTALHVIGTRQESLGSEEKSASRPAAGRVQ